MDRFKNKYRIGSTRLQKWDYSWSAAYFITVCTANRENYFGEINNQIMKLSHAGVLADVFWYEIKNHAQNIELDEYIVMPNHVHGIIILKGNNKSKFDNVSSTNVETRHALSLKPPQNNQNAQTPGQQRFQNQGKNSVSSIIGSYKSAVSKHANRLELKMKWQPRFHDHIIRDGEEFQRIKNYIANNPANWNDDKFFN
jgi:REP element-mobilizing transposase RayT